MSPHTTPALLSHPPKTPKTPNWTLTPLTLPRDLPPHTLLIQHLATGICHTDIMLTTLPPSNPLGVQYPKVVGHEGSGYVRGIGEGVREGGLDVAVGAPVLLSYSACGVCKPCVRGRPYFCDEFDPLNFVGAPTFSMAVGKEEEEVWGQFFGQSSFAEWSVVRASSVVNVGGLGVSGEELRLFAPLGCGLQTGAGAVINAAAAGKEDQVLVMGLGGVGLSAVMAAKLQNCPTIIALDRLPSRLVLARSLGATHTIDTSDTSLDPVLEVLRCTDGEGASVVIDTTAAPALLDRALEMTARRGKFVVVGAAGPEHELRLPTFKFMTTGKIVMGCIEGDSVPSVFIPKLIQWYREGKFPIDKLVKFFPVAEFKDALEAMHSGEAIKPVLLW